MSMRHTSTIVAAVLALTALVPVGAAVADPKATSTRLTNLDHLDFLGDTVTPP